MVSSSLEASGASAASADYEADVEDDDDDDDFNDPDEDEEFYRQAKKDFGFWIVVFLDIITSVNGCSTVWVFTGSITFFHWLVITEY